MMLIHQLDRMLLSGLVAPWLGVNAMVKGPKMTQPCRRRIGTRSDACHFCREPSPPAPGRGSVKPLAYRGKPLGFCVAERCWDGGVFSLPKELVPTVAQPHHPKNLANSHFVCRPFISSSRGFVFFFQGKDAKSTIGLWAWVGLMNSQGASNGEWDRWW